MTASTYRTDVFSGVKTFNSVQINAVTGFTPDQYDLLVERWGFLDNGGDYTTERTLFTLAGYTGTNTDEVDKDGVMTQRVYFKATGTTNYTVTGWKDAAMTASQVCGGEIVRASGGAVTLSASNTSGLTGSFTASAAATNDEWYVDIVLYHDRYDGNVDYASLNILGFLWREDLKDESAVTLWSYAESGTIANFDNLLDCAGIDNVADAFKKKTLRDQLRLRGWLV